MTLFAGTAASAHAALIDSSACDGAAVSQPFAAWGDTNDYKVVPGGDFEGSLAGWTLTGGAAVVSGNESSEVAGGSHSLYLPAGATATTPLTCVDAAYPTARFFNKTNSLSSTILVQLVYSDPVLGLVPLAGGIDALRPAWNPSAKVLTFSAIPGALDGGTAQVALRFTAVGGAAQIDDIYVDPRMKA